MQIDFEILIMFTVSLVFTLLALLVIDQAQKVLMSMLSAIAWYILGLAYIAADSTFPMYSYLFLGIGIIFTAYTLIEASEMINEGKPFRGR